MKPLVTRDEVKKSVEAGIKPTDFGVSIDYAIAAARLNAALELLLAEREAARDAQWIASLTNNGEGGTALTDHFKDALARHDAAVRLEEAKWWHAQRGHHGQNWCCERLAALEVKP
jgi:hypothetical protein